MGAFSFNEYYLLIKKKKKKRMTVIYCSALHYASYTLSDVAAGEVCHTGHMAS